MIVNNNDYKNSEDYKRGLEDGAKIAKYWKEKFERGVLVEREECAKICESHVTNKLLTNYGRAMFKSSMELIRLRKIHN